MLYTCLCYYLQEIVIKVARILYCTTHEIRGGSRGSHVKTNPGKVDDGRDTVRLNVLPREVTRPLQVLHVHDRAFHPIGKARGAQHVPVPGVGQGHVGLGVGAETRGSQGQPLTTGVPAAVEDVLVSQVSEEELRLTRLSALLSDRLQHTLHGGEEV